MKHLALMVSRSQWTADSVNVTHVMQVVAVIVCVPITVTVFQVVHVSVTSMVAGVGIFAKFRAVLVSILTAAAMESAIVK